MKTEDLVRLSQETNQKALCPKGYHLHDTQVVRGETCDCFDLSLDEDTIQPENFNAQPNKTTVS